ncbi:MAG TPA: histone deacetylase [Gemmatales bacterium]|nr:histone deacetylase [Gemmatales bacterium]
MKAYYCDHFVLPLPEGHRFPMLKYRLLREKLLAENVPVELAEPQAVSDQQLQQAHEPRYVQRVLHGRMTEAEIRRLGFPWSLALVERSRRSSGGTLAACRAALQDGFAANLAGGTHHAGYDFAEGFCLFNDAAVATRALQAEGVVQRVLIIDADVHQGNGTAHIFQHDSSVFTFSIHGEHNFPLRKIPGRLDVGLADGTGDVEYLAALQRGLTQAIPDAKADLAIYLAGADPYEGDRLGRLRLTKSGLLARDRMVFDHCQAARLPVAIAMAGGYAPDVQDIVEIQYNTIREAAGRV